MTLTRRYTVPLALAATLALPVTASAQSTPVERLPGKVLATGLDNPRGIVQGPGGAVYVAEAGRGGDGPCVERTPGQRLCIGATGAVTEVKRGRKRRILTGLPSLAGPDGVSAIGPSDVTRRNNRVFTVVGLGDRPSSRAQLGELGGRLGWLFQNRDGEAFPIADIAGHAGADVPSNPFAVTNVGKQMYVADAGAKSVVVVQSGGTLRTKAQLDVVPSAIGNAGKQRIYISEMTDAPFRTDRARVFRLGGGGVAPKVFAKQFTHLIDIVPAGFGSLYVLEATRGGSSGRSTGRVLHMEPGGQVRHVVARNLPAPGGFSIDPLTGKVYATLNADRPGDGALVLLPGHGTTHASVGTPQGQYPDMTKATKRGLREGRKLWKATLRRKARFQFARARREGYRFTSKNPPPVPGVFHLRKDKLDYDKYEMDPRRPESLVYYNTTRGKKILVAFMYRARTLQFPSVTRGLLGWHRHGSTRAALPMTHVWMTGDLRSALANCLPVPELEQALDWTFEGSSPRVSGLEGLPCGKPGDVVTG